MADPATKRAERATLAAGMWRHADHQRVRTLVDHDNYWYPEHANLSRALDELADIGPFLTTATYDDIAALWPQTMPSSVNVRLGALAAMCDRWPLWALQRLLGHATGHPERDAAEVARRARLRDEAEVLRARLTEIEGA